MDLFTPILPTQKLHPNFINTIKEHEPYARMVLDQWAEGFFDRDGKFVKEFQSSYNSSFWELYVYSVLKDLGFDVDFSHGRPDFYFRGHGMVACIEASIASSGLDMPKEWEAKYSPENLSQLNMAEIVDYATIRLANTLTAKYKKYQNEYSSLSHVNNLPFIIAIAPFEQPFSYLQNEQAIRRVLYAFDNYDYVDNPETNERLIYGKRFLDYIAKPNGAKVPLGYFTKGRMNEISAVIFSNTATFGKVRALSQDPRDFFFESIRYNDNGLNTRHTILPKKEYHETLLDGLHVFHNPYADHPISFNIFDKTDITQNNFDVINGELLISTYDNFLFQRSAQQIITHTQQQRNKIYEAARKANKNLASMSIDSRHPLTIRVMDYV